MSDPVCWTCTAHIATSTAHRHGTRSQHCHSTLYGTVIAYIHSTRPQRTATAQSHDNVTAHSTPLTDPAHGHSTVTAHGHSTVTACPDDGHLVGLQMYLVDLTLPLNRAQPTRTTPHGRCSPSALTPQSQRTHARTARETHGQHDDPPPPHHGCSTLTLTLNLTHAMAESWLRRRSAYVDQRTTLRACHPHNTRTPQAQHGHSMFTARSQHGHSTVTARSQQGHSTATVPTMSATPASSINSARAWVPSSIPPHPDGLNSARVWLAKK